MEETMRFTKLFVTTLAALAPLSLFGCSGSEEYEISGEVKAAATAGAITVEFFEVDGEEHESLKRIELAAPGSFKEKVEATTDARLLVRAIADADDNGACTEGELWDEAEATPKDGKVAPVVLELTAATCPKSQ
jgi:hypothetical protein